MSNKEIFELFKANNLDNEKMSINKLKLQEL